MTGINTDNGFLRRMTAADLRMVLIMRNHPQVRRYMLTQHEITIEEHMKWYQSASHNPGIELLVYELNDKCCGFVQFKKTSFQGILDWGFYTDPLAPVGTGKKLGRAALRHAFGIGGIHKICGQALQLNVSSIKFHKSLGFMQEGVLRDHYFDGLTYHDLVCFGFLKREWSIKELQKD